MFFATSKKVFKLRNLSSKMLPKYHVRMHDVRPSNSRVDGYVHFSGPIFVCEID